MSKRTKKRARQIGQSMRRENIAALAGFKVWRYRSKIPLTPRAVRAQMVRDNGVKLTPLDRVLSEHQADVLERWACNEQLLHGRTKTASLEKGGGGIVTGKAPIADGVIYQVGRHQRCKRTMSGNDLRILQTFTQQQNNDADALTPAEAGLEICPMARNKSEAYYQALQGAAEGLISRKY